MNKKWVSHLLTTLSLLMFVTPWAEAWIKLPQSRARLISDYKTVQPGQTIQVGLEIELDRGWHTYAEKPGDSGAPPRFDLLAPDQFQVGPIQFPPPETIRTGPITTYGYHNHVLFKRSLTVPSTRLDEKNFNLQSKVEYLVCNDICVPAYTDFSILLNYGTPELSEEARVFSQPLASSHEDQEAEFSLGLIALWAFLGGALLNLMPCVFPVLSIKALQMSDVQNKYAHLIYAGGIIVSLWILGLSLVVLRASGEAIGWGFQLQSPLFVGVIGFVFTLLSLNLFGVFEMGERLQNVGSSLNIQKVWLKEFLSGVLTVLVAAPCTAPFMGAAIGFSLSQSPATILLTMTFLGLGLSSPFLLLYLFPQLHKALPRPGHWMVTFKVVMGFPMLLTTLWMIWLLMGLKDAATAFAYAAGLIVFSLFFVWQARSKKITKAILLTLSLALAAFTIYTAQAETQSARLQWSAFTSTSYAQARASDKIYFIDFTADWCLSCKVNERLVFNNESVQKFLLDHDIQLMKADWTKRNPEITTLLSKYNRAGVPFYMIFKGNEEIILPEVLTSEVFLERTEQFVKQKTGFKRN